MIAEPEIQPNPTQTRIIEVSLFWVQFAVPASLPFSKFILSTTRADRFWVQANWSQNQLVAPLVVSIFLCQTGNMQSLTVPYAHHRNSMWKGHPFGDSYCSYDRSYCGRISQFFFLSSFFWSITYVCL